MIRWVLAILCIAAAVLGTGAATRANETPGFDDGSSLVCASLRQQVSGNDRNGAAWVETGTDVVLLHTAGCDETADGVWSHRVYANEHGVCNDLAYAIAAAYVDAGIDMADDDGMLFGALHTAVVATGICASFEDDGTWQWIGGRG